MSLLETKVEDHVLVVTILESTLKDEGMAKEIGGQLSDLVSDENPRILLNLENVEFMSSVMVGQLFVVYGKCRASGIELKMCGVSELMHTVLSLVRMDNFIDILKDIEDGKASFGQSAIETSYWDFGDRSEELRSAAEQGDAVAQFELAQCCEFGRGVSHDPAEAFAWFQKAAEAGHADGQHRLAVAYAYGIATDQNLGEAIRWYRAAAEQGHVESQYALGMSYHYGIGVEENIDEARQWYEKAAAQGHEKSIEEAATL